MDTRIALSIVVGVIFFFISLVTIKTGAYYYKSAEIPEVVYKDDVKNLTTAKNTYLRLMKKGDTNAPYTYQEIITELNKYRDEKKNNYLTAIFIFIGGTALTYLVTSTNLKKKGL